VWTVLESDNITTLDQLKAVADRIERIPGVGSKTAEAIRAELARVMASEQQLPDEDRSSNP
jgi:Holliday junction resolvasome RuvABC DNA-binding subunit